jgi:hypothetical protein
MSIFTEYCAILKTDDKILYKKSELKHVVFLILIVVFLIASSCIGKKTAIDKKDIIPEKELISLLVDIHLADGLLALPKIYADFSSLDSIAVYYQIIENHGYTKEIMDKTLKYYFVNDPKKLNKIYDQALGILSEMESRVESESFKEMARLANQWPGKEFYAFPELTGNDSTLFDKTLYRPGIYTLTFTATLFSDDRSVNPRTTAYTCSPDSIETGKRKYAKTVNFIKDGYPHIYKLTFLLPESKIHHLRGWLFDFDNQLAAIEKHIKIETISLTFSPSVVP